MRYCYQYNTLPLKGRAVGKSEKALNLTRYQIMCVFFKGCNNVGVKFQLNIFNRIRNISDRKNKMGYMLDHPPKIKRNDEYNNKNQR